MKSTINVKSLISSSVPDTYIATIVIVIRSIKYVVLPDAPYQGMAPLSTFRSISPEQKFFQTSNLSSRVELLLPFSAGNTKWSIMRHHHDSGVNLYLEKQQDNITRGHSLKLVNNRYHYDLRKFSFAPSIVDVWNSLPEIVISAATTDTFKRRLDRFWQHQDILYDYKVELTGVGNRSQINTDDNAL